MRPIFPWPVRLFMTIHVGMLMTMHTDHGDAAGGNYDQPGARQPSSIAYRIDRAQRLVYVVVSGAVQLDRVYDAGDAIFADPDYRPGFDVMVECRVLTSIPSPEEIRELALSGVLRRSASTHGRLAIVTTTERAYEAASLLEMYLDAPADRLAVFTNPVQARAWLALPGEP